MYHDSHNLLFRSPFGAVETGTPITLRLKFTEAAKPDSVFVRLWHGDSESLVQMQPADVSQVASAEIGGECLYEATFSAPDTPGLVWYSFGIHQGVRTLYYCNNPQRTGGAGRLLDHLADSYQITVYERGFSTPEWFRDAIVYQIMVDRFHKSNPKDSAKPHGDHAVVHQSWNELPCYKDGGGFARRLCNDFFGGNLRGIREKLPYLRSLGVKAIYLNPIFEASSNHKYDTGDYMRIDPMFGDLEDFTQLCSEARSMGIAVILDGVFSHTGSDSVYFNKDGRYPSIGAYQSVKSPYYSWYRFRKHPNDYECWWGVDTLPNVNELDPSYKEFIATGEDSVTKHWLRLGAKGWRLDVADELPDEFIETLRAGTRATDSDSVLIGEVWEDASNKVSYGAQRGFVWGRQFDSIMNYPFRELTLSFLLGRSTKCGSPFDARDLHKGLMSLYENYPRPVFYSLLNLIGSHDVARAMTILGEAPPEECLSLEQRAAYTAHPPSNYLGKRRLKLAALLQMTFPGVPCIYYGDEAGLEGYRDPLNRCTYPWGREDAELLEWYRLLAQIRNSHACLRSGEWFSPYHEGPLYVLGRLVCDGTDVFGLERANNAAVICVNRDPHQSRSLRLDLRWLECERVFDALAGYSEVAVRDGFLDIQVPALGACILLKHKSDQFGSGSKGDVNCKKPRVDLCLSCRRARHQAKCDMIRIAG